MSWQTTGCGQTALRTRQVLLPPKPNELEMATRTFAGRASLATWQRLHSGSGSCKLIVGGSTPRSIAAVREALEDAGCNPEDVDYINAHATSTPVGDIAEARVLNAVFGDAIHRVPISSTKSMTGHLLTAAAAVEVLACLAAMERGALPPTINLHDPDPECNLRHVANEARPAKVRIAVSNSFGFGGSNTCLVLKSV